MPNTLAHYGVQLLPGKLLAPGADIRWLALGCLIPDLPWILQRILPLFAPAVDLLDLRLYCLIQASFFFCLLLSSAIALLSSNSREVFVILAANSLIHLLLDALQTKWANGVHLLAPLSWLLTQFHLFWPEDRITLLLSLAGLTAIAWFGWRDRFLALHVTPVRSKLLLSVVLGLLYFLLPPILFQGPLQADNHYTRTLQDIQHRPGSTIEFDRCRYDVVDRSIEIFTGERLMVSGRLPEVSGVISLSGRFIDERTVFIDTLHQHNRLRDVFSYCGLLLLLIIWAMALFRGNADRVKFPPLNSSLLR